MKQRTKRLVAVLVGLGGVSLAVALTLNAFRDNLVFFFSPSQVLAQEAPLDRAFRIGGLVEDGSVQREGIRVSFNVTDTAAVVPVVFDGILPDLFREGQGVVAVGRLLEGGVFHANQVLAKHDETYMPPEAAEAIKQAQREQARVMPPEEL
ncbi:cytochrome c maturation protein CcmE [Thiorhodospira sibirica]|uniref:cytochrome c maturation protein CcmE n=1 Tax=Thiorhodospira sibirica TaxID=154347 RepID=UPI00022C285F|nr:cytochrome c maturation protein CcmE [Thiorhodospira sibirica]